MSLKENSVYLVKKNLNNRGVYFLEKSLILSFENLFSLEDNYVIMVLFSDSGKNTFFGGASSLKYTPLLHRIKNYNQSSLNLTSSRYGWEWGVEEDEDLWGRSVR